MEELIKLVEEQGKLWKSWRDAQEKAQKDGSQNTSEFKVTMEKIEKDLETLESKIDKLQVEANRPKSVGEGEQETKDEKSKREVTEKKAAFFKFLAKGMDINALNETEKKTMVLADDTSLGYLAPSEWWADILRNIVEWSPVRQLATVRVISSREIHRPKKTQATTASWIGETGLPSASDLKHGMIKVPAHKLGALSKVSPDALDDISLLESEIRADFVEQFAVAEGAAFISGNANEKPEGILTNSDVSITTTAVTAQLSYDDLIDLEASLKEFYYPNARFLMNRQIRKHLRKLKDSNGQYLWQPAVGLDTPATIMGYPYTLCTDLASSVATNNKPIIFGDIRRAYLIVDRRNLAVQVLKELYLPLTAYFGTQRVGGQVQLPEAVKILKIK